MLQEVVMNSKPGGCWLQMTLLSTHTNICRRIHSFWIAGYKWRYFVFSSTFEGGPTQDVLSPIWLTWCEVLFFHEFVVVLIALLERLIDNVNVCVNCCCVFASWVSQCQRIRGGLSYRHVVFALWVSQCQRIRGGLSYRQPFSQPVSSSALSVSASWVRLQSYSINDATQAEFTDGGTDNFKCFWHFDDIWTGLDQAASIHLYISQFLCLPGF